MPEGGWLERARTRRRLHACDAVGTGARAIDAPMVQNLGRITIGRDFALSSRPVQSHLVTGVRGVLEIGDRVRIGHGAAVAAHAHVQVGDDVRIGPFVMIMDTDFHEAGDHGAAPEPRPIRIGAGARIGARVTILPGATIGAGATVLAGSVVSAAVAPGVTAGGVPAREIREGERAGGAALERIPEIVRRTFGLGAAPAGSDGPDAVAGWDSLGTLNLLLSLEEEFGVAIDPADLLAVECVDDLRGVVERAQEHATAQ